MLQDIRSGQLDILTAGEMTKVLHEHYTIDRFTKQERAHLAGIKVFKLPLLRAAGNGGTLNLTSTPGGAPCGPEAGFIWNVWRINVLSSASADTATYALYGGSDIQNFQPNSAIDLGPTSTTPTYSTTYTALVNVATVPATGGNLVNQNNFAVAVTISGGTVTAIGGNSALTSGTFVIPAGGTLAVTCSVAPTVSTAIPPNAQPAYITGTSTKQGLSVGQAYYPSSKGIFLYPGEQIYSQVLNSVSANQYTLQGVAVQVPAEMQGKFL